MSEVLLFQCHQCHDTFHHRVALTDKPTVILVCPFCGTKCSVDFNPYGQNVVTILRDGGKLNTSDISLPPVVPTQQSE